MATPTIDPWLLGPDGKEDPFAATVDFRLRPEDAIDPDAGLEHFDGLNPQVVGPLAPSDDPPAPTAQVPPPDEPDVPEVLNLKDGGSVTLEKERGQWKATLDPGNGANPEVFWGKNKNELLTNTLEAKLNATKKIRELNAKVKLGTVPRQAPKPATVTTARELTGDEIFEISTQLSSNPDLALSNWFQKKTGQSVQQLLDLAAKGAKAEASLEAEAVSRAFIQNNPDYNAVPKNFELLVKWLAKFKLGKTATDIDETMYELTSSGNWTVENLEEAFQDLSSDGLLVTAPKPPITPPPVAVQPNEPAPAPRPDSRIVSQVTRPRAATGIGRTDVTPVAPPATPTAPSAEDLESLDDKQIAALMAGVRRQRVLSRRT